jgi:hypothetical protein
MLSGGFYRVDLTKDISVLSMNSMYMDALDLSTHNGEADLILTWLAAQLALAKEEERKVIVIDHVYAGSNFEPPKLW